MIAKSREHVLTETQINALSISRLIFHVINTDGAEDKVVELSEVTLDDDQKRFFLERIKSVSKGIQYSFIQNNLATKNICLELLSNANLFQKKSVELTQLFANHHKRNMSDGVFVIAIVTTINDNGQPFELIFLAKFDHKNVYQILVKTSKDGAGNVAQIQKVANSLVEDKSAIQKSALVDTGSTFVWDVLADERKLKDTGEVTDYFKGFLGVHLMEVASVLTRRAFSVVSSWQRTVSAELMPPDEERGNYKMRAVSYLETSDMFEINDFLSSIVKDTDPTRRSLAIDSLRLELTIAGVDNQKFPPKPNSLPKKERKQVWKTNEGVVLEFFGEHSDFGIEVSERTDGLQGKIIVITTSGYEAK